MRNAECGIFADGNTSRELKRNSGLQIKKISFRIGRFADTSGGTAVGRTGACDVEFELVFAVLNAAKRNQCGMLCRSAPHSAAGFNDGIFPRAAV